MIQKHIATKVGDIFKTKETSKGHRYLQLVAIDHANLNSDVIAVFAPTSEHLSENYDELVKFPIEFYYHTTVSQGVKQGLWEKVGKAPVRIDLSKLVFKHYVREAEIEVAENSFKRTGDAKLRAPYPDPYWQVWTALDEHFHAVSGNEGSTIMAEWGGITPAERIIERIEKGYNPPRWWPKG